VLHPVAAETLATGFVPDRSGFQVRFGDQRVPYRLMGVFALPAEDVPIEVSAVDSGYRLDASAGTLTALAANRWRWRAPERTGVAVLRVHRPDDGEVVTLHVFVMAPYAEMKNGRLHGYRIGAYPAPRERHAEIDLRPRGFVEITPETADLPVSPHFRLGQFACKSGAGLPKYAVVQPRLLLRLEDLLETANRRGVRASTFRLMSAYRTPVYNRSIGNPTTFTRHQYGDAADIFVDESPVDGRMDDLNGDGRLDRDDAMVLQRWADETMGPEGPDGFVGGLSAYAPTNAHGAFVHVDTRGYRARW
jgi:hypothetical protein